MSKAKAQGMAGSEPAPPLASSPRSRGGRPPVHSEPRLRQKPLRVTARDDELMALVRPYLINVTNESELAYQLVREGLLMRLALLAALGGDLNDLIAEEVVAAHAAQHLLLCLPLLRRTGKLATLEMEVHAVPTGTRDITPSPPQSSGERNRIGVDDLDDRSGLDAEGLGGGLI